MSATLDTTPAVAAILPKRKRLYSLDALRGFDMFWIMSGEHIIHAAAKVTGWPVLLWMSGQLHHTDWNGFTFYDMIFPLFLFIAGVSLPYSVGSKVGHASKVNIYQSMIRRTIILILLGMIVNGLLNFHSYEDTRYASVLGRIGIAWFFASLIYLNFGLRSQLIWFITILLGYWAMMTLIPVPGFGAGNLTPEGALSSYIDRILLPGKLHNGVFDPEGIFTTLPSIATAMLGVFCGSFLHNSSLKFKEYQKGFILLGAGLVFLLAGYLWGFAFPINKRLWTSSFVLFAGGWSMILLSIFFLIVDVLGWKKWTVPLIWIGSNSILIYLCAEGLVNFGATANFLFGGSINLLPVRFEQLGIAVSVTLVQLIFLWILYTKKIFMKV